MIHKALQKKYTHSPSSPSTNPDPSNVNPSNTDNNTSVKDQSYSHTADQSSAKTTIYQGQTQHAQFQSHQSSLSAGGAQEELIERCEAYNTPKTGVRVTSDCFPSTRQLQKSSHLPIAAVIQPFASIYPPDSFPLLKFGSGNSHIRCKHCLAYMNPFAVFTDNGAKYRCNLCNKLNITPSSYYAEVDPSTGDRVDRSSKVELCCGAFDLKAGSDYMIRPPMPPTFVFLLDVSAEATTSGMLKHSIEIIKGLVVDDQIPGGNRTQVGFMTYDSHIHYCLQNPNLKSPQLVTVAPTQELSQIPFPDDFLVNLSDTKTHVLTLLNSLPAMFSKNKSHSSCLMAAITAVSKGMGHMGGRLLVLHASSNTINHKLPPSQMNVKASLDHSELDKLITEMHQNFISLTFFMCSRPGNDMQSVQEIVKHTSGEMYYYNRQSESHQQRFYYEFKHCITKTVTWEAVFRVRISTGWRIVTRYGNFSLRNNDLLSLSSIDDKKALVYQFELDEKIAQTDAFYLQSSLLYTTTSGERRVRIMNYCVPLVSALQHVYLKADSQALSIYLLRKALASKGKAQDLQAVRTQLLQQAQLLVKDMTTACNITQPGVYTDSFSTFPLLILGILKHELLSASDSGGSGVVMEDRETLRLKLNALNAEETALHFAPYLFALHTVAEEGAGVYDEQDGFIFPQLLSLTCYSLSKEGMYLMDDGMNLYILLGSKADSHQLTNLFNVQSILDLAKFTEGDLVIDSDDPTSKGVRTLIAELRQRRSEGYSELFIMKEGERCNAMARFYSRFLEDNSAPVQAIHCRTKSSCETYIVF